MAASRFTAPLGKLTHGEQKAVKTSVFGQRTNPRHAGLKLHRTGESMDRNLWSYRVGRDIRIGVLR